MQARDRAIDEWFSRISTGQVQLPRFQRFEAWGNREVQDLLETVLAELPAGATLVLEVGDTPIFKHRPLQEAPAGSERLTELLLDGQQRLTALWRSLNDTYEDRTFFVELTMDGEENGGRGVVSERRYWKDGQRYPLWAKDPKKTLERGYLPLRLLRPGDEGSQELNLWLKKATEGNLEQYIDVLNTANDLRTRVARFNLPYLFLTVGTKKDTVLDVFVKMNTRSVRLTAFDITVAEVEADAGDLYPVKYLRDFDEEGKASNALNCAMVTWRTNRAIAAKQPVDYLLERAEASALGEEELRRRLKSHAVPYESMVAGNYEEFLLKRALIAETAVKMLCVGSDWTPFESVE